jgi:hypothetical protein
MANTTPSRAKAAKTRAAKALAEKTVKAAGAVKSAPAAKPSVRAKPSKSAKGPIRKFGPPSTRNRTARPAGRGAPKSGPRRG